MAERIRRPAVLLALLLAGCAHVPQPVSINTTKAVLPVESVSAFGRGLDVAEEYLVTEIEERRFTHDQLWSVLGPLIDSDDFIVEEVGRSIAGRSIMTVTFGEGPVTVLLWSQMHGDESTASMALVDIINFLGGQDSDLLRNRLREHLTIVMIPMLNPDGAELFQRRNAIGVDINRDARRLATPEARILKEVRDRVDADFGFNLHDQNPHTQAGRDGPRAAIALLAPAADFERSWGEVRTKARTVASVIAGLLETRIPGRVAKYGDAFNPRAFGDLMQQWGTSTVLIESGVLDDDPEKQQLRALNVAALLAALDAIARDGLVPVDTAWYDSLPSNRGFTHDLLVRGGMLILPGAAPLPVDLAFAWEDGVRKSVLLLSEVGDLEEEYALEVIEATDLYIHLETTFLSLDESGAWLLIDEPAAITLRRGPDRESELVMRIGEYR
ncbi:M14 family zinc carboxypeptidase [Gemmatimonadota bacterium]